MSHRDFIGRSSQGLTILLLLFNIPAIRMILNDFQLSLLVGLIGTAVGAFVSVCVLDDVVDVSEEPRSLSWEAFLKFLRSEDLASLSCAAEAGDAHLVILMLKYAAPAERLRLTPDTLEAADAAAADANLWDAAEDKVDLLRTNTPKVWEAIARVAPKITEEIAESDIRKLERRFSNSDCDSDRR